MCVSSSFLISSGTRSVCACVGRPHPMVSNPAYAAAPRGKDALKCAENREKERLMGKKEEATSGQREEQ